MKKPFIKSARIIFFVIFSINLFFFIVGSKALSWYKDRFGVTIIEILYTIKSLLKGADTSFLHTLILDVLLYTMIWALAVFAIVLIHKIKQIVVVETVLHKKIRINVLCWIMYISFAHSLFGAVYTIVDAYNTLDVKTYVDSVMAETSIYEDYYIYPEVDKIKATKPKNLLHIYLESMETTYASKDIGGYQQEYNYIPKLTNIADEYISFSDNEKLGGFYSTSRTGYTMGLFLQLKQEFHLLFQSVATVILQIEKAWPRERLP